MQQLTATWLWCAFQTTDFPHKKVNVCMNLNELTFNNKAAGHLLTQHTFRWLSVSLWLVQQTESVTLISRWKKKAGKKGLCKKTTSRQLDHSWLRWEGKKSTFFHFFYLKHSNLKKLSSNRTFSSVMIHDCYGVTSDLCSGQDSAVQGCKKI